MPGDIFKPLPSKEIAAEVGRRRLLSCILAITDTALADPQKSIPGRRDDTSTWCDWCWCEARRSSKKKYCWRFIETSQASCSDKWHRCKATRTSCKARSSDKASIQRQGKASEARRKRRYTRSASV